MDYVVVIFTPYSVECDLVNKILLDLRGEIAFTEALRKRVELNEQDVEVLYPKLVNRPYFKDIVACMTGGSSEFVLIVADTVHQAVGQLKGKFMYNDGLAAASGLREKYRRDNHSFEFVFHTTDSNLESDQIGLRLFGLEYQDALKPQAS